MKDFACFAGCLFALVLVAGCNNVEPDNTFKGSSHGVTIKPGETKQLLGDVWVTFIEATGDSRCPIGVECVWQGEVNLLFNIEGPVGTDTLRIRGFVGSDGEDPIYVGMPSVPDHWFYLDRFDPYPGAEEVEPVATISLWYNRARTL